MRMFGLFSRKKSKQSLGLDWNSQVSDNVIRGEGVTFGSYSMIGTGDIRDGNIVIGNNVKIGSYCIISHGVQLGDNVVLDDYTKICAGVKIGNNTRVIYGKHVYNDAIIGDNCIIGGHVADRTKIGNSVTYMGEIAHSHRNPNGDWDETEEPSPIILDGCVIGVNAILIGGIKIGPCAYIGAGEIVRTNVEKDMALIKSEIQPLSYYRGLIKARCQ